MVLGVFRLSAAITLSARRVRFTSGRDLVRGPRCRPRHAPRIGVMTPWHGLLIISRRPRTEDGRLWSPRPEGGFRAEAEKGDARPRRLDGTGPAWSVPVGSPPRISP